MYNYEIKSKSISCMYTERNMYNFSKYHWKFGYIFYTVKKNLQLQVKQISVAIVSATKFLVNVTNFFRSKNKYVSWSNQLNL